MFALYHNGDLKVENRKYAADQDGETRLLTALFTNARVNKQHGYWFDNILSSQIWRFEQARDSIKNRSEIALYANIVLKKLVQKGYYSFAEASIDDNILVVKTVRKNGSQTYVREYKL